MHHTSTRMAGYLKLPALIVGACLGTLCLLGPAVAQQFDSRATHALLLDVETGTVLFEKQADTAMPPASMAKLMTLTVVFDALQTGQLSSDDEFVVSENAWRTGGASSGGSTMFAGLGSNIRIADLVRGVIVQSGNDSCIILAEGMAGTEPTFASVMNQHARKLGLTGSNFTNSTGLPDPDQHVTARDLAVIAEHLITTHPDHYAIFAEEKFTWNKITQRNRNPLVHMDIGADGLKTGFTEASGYGLVGSAKRDGQRLIVVLNGVPTSKARAEEARKLLDWGFRAFERVELFDRREVIGKAKVFGGDQSTVGLVSKGTVDLLLPRGNRDLIKGRIYYQGPVEAPVEEGQAIGELRITMGERTIMVTPLFAGADVDTGSLTQRAGDGLQELILGWF
jgi:D-alanyl-D-alanine carboxypeptidase (penicillin-binding protein 5/6)